MRVSTIASRTFAGLALGLALSASAVAQWVNAPAPNQMNNPNGNVGIRLGATGGPGFAPICDPLHIGNAGGVNPAVRLSGGGLMPVGGVCGGGLFCAYAQYGFEAGGGGAFAPGVSTANDVVLATQGCAEDVILAANGVLTGDIRFATKNGAGLLLERMTVTDNTGNVGINMAAPVNRLDVRGSMAIGSYAGASVAPANGLIVSGSVGLGTSAPAYQLDVAGDVRTSATLHLGTFIEDGTGNFGASGDVLTVDPGTGNAVWLPPGAGSNWTLGGNAVAATTNIGTTTAFDFPIITNNVEKMRVTSAGRVGIGMVAPTYMLDVAGDVRTAATLHLGTFVEDGTGNLGASGDVLTVDPGTGNAVWLPPGAGSNWVLGGNGVTGLTNLGTTSSFDLPLITNGTEKMRVTVAGDVGIGTTAPTQMLEVNGNTQVNGDVILGAATSQLQDGSGSTGATGDIFQKDGSNLPRWTPIGTIITGSAWGLTGNSGTSPITSGGTNFIGTAASTSTDFDVATDGDVAMTIGGTTGFSPNKGNVLIGGGNGTPAGTTYKFEVMGGNSRFNGNLTVTGTFTVSDARLKENVTTIDNALERIQGLRGVTYDFSPSAPARMNLPKTHQVGFIAQEVQQVVPEAVGTTSEGYMSVNYPELIPILVEGMKEQQATIRTQQAQIDALTSRLTQLERQMGAPVKVPEKTEGGAGLRAR